MAFTSIMALRFILRRGNKRFVKVTQETDPNDTAAIAQLDDDTQRAVLNGFRYIT
jgi:hypothetical protein